MKKITYRKLDAFSNRQSNGNPAACLYLESEKDLTVEQMQNIAKEHKGFVSEVIYCWQIEESLYRLRYYSSECEVEFCGHGTIACIYDLICNNEELRKLEGITIRTNKGDLKVYNELDTLDAVFITAPEPQYLEILVSLTDIINNLNILEKTIDNSFPIMTIDAGLRTLIVPIVDMKNLVRIQPSESKLKDFCLKNDIDIILVFTTEVTDSNNKMRTRVFAPKFGYLEDPATGSGNSAFGYYMAKHGLWDGNPISIEQNAEIDNYNIVKLKMMENQVLFGGNAIVKINGYYLF